MICARIGHKFFPFRTVKRISDDGLHQVVVDKFVCERCLREEDRERAESVRPLESAVAAEKEEAEREAARLREHVPKAQETFRASIRRELESGLPAGQADRLYWQIYAAGEVIQAGVRSGLSPDDELLPLIEARTDASIRLRQLTPQV